MLIVLIDMPTKMIDEQELENLIASCITDLLNEKNLVVDVATASGYAAKAAVAVIVAAHLGEALNG